MMRRGKIYDGFGILCLRSGWFVELVHGALVLIWSNNQNVVLECSTLTPPDKAGALSMNDEGR